MQYSSGFVTLKNKKKFAKKVAKEQLRLPKWLLKKTIKIEKRENSNCIKDQKSYKRELKCKSNKKQT